MLGGRASHRVRGINVLCVFDGVGVLPTVCACRGHPQGLLQGGVARVEAVASTAEILEPEGTGAFFRCFICWGGVRIHGGGRRIEL